jgi:hypothetical protein
LEDENRRAGGRFVLRDTHGPNGRPQTILGTFQRDGKHFVFSTNDDMGSGMVGDDELEYCWSTSSQRFLGTGCATYKRNK